MFSAKDKEWIKYIPLITVLLENAYERVGPEDIKKEIEIMKEYFLIQSKELLTCYNDTTINSIIYKTHKIAKELYKYEENRKPSWQEYLLVVEILIDDLYIKMCKAKEYKRNKNAIQKIIFKIEEYIENVSNITENIANKYNVYLADKVNMTIFKSRL